MSGPQKIYRFHDKDARKLTEVIPPRTVDVVITSPPYFRRKKYTPSNDEIGREKDIKIYLENLKDIFQKCYEATKNTGSLWVVIDTYREKGELKLLPFYVAEKVKECGWVLRDVLIWDKVKTRPWSKNGRYRYLRRIFEYILFFTKTKTNEFKFFMDTLKEPDPTILKKWWVDYPERYNPQGATPTNLWKVTIPTQGGWGRRYLKHFCPFPPVLVERVLQLTTKKGDVVLDPFAGSGMVLAQAHHMGRKYIGFEINPEYVKAFGRVCKEVGYKVESVKEIGETFRRTIKKLRLVKYPKATLQGALKNIPSNKVSLNTIFAISTNFENACPMKEEIYFILNSKTREPLSPHFNKIGSKLPLSVFEIKSNFHFLTRSEFEKRKINFPKTLWLYAHGVVRAPAYPITLKEWKRKSGMRGWMKLSKNGVPPIASNINTGDDLFLLFKYVQDRQPNSPLLKIKLPNLSKLSL